LLYIVEFPSLFKKIGLAFLARKLLSLSSDFSEPFFCELQQTVDPDMEGKYMKKKAFFKLNTIYQGKSRLRSVLRYGENFPIAGFYSY